MSDESASIAKPRSFLMTKGDNRRNVTLAVIATSIAAWIVYLRLCGASVEQMSMDSSALWRAQLLSLIAMELFWLLTVIGMMLPSMLVPIWHLHDRSFCHRRVHSIIIFCIAYLVPWLALGLAFVPMMVAQVSTWSFAVFSIVCAFVWQCSPLKQRCLNRCHALPAVRGFGWAANIDVARFGLRHGVACVGACWALMMAAMSLPTGHLAMMGAVAVWIFGEKLERPEAPRWQLRAPKKLFRLACFKLRSIAAAT